MFINYNTEQYEIQYPVSVCDFFLTEEIYNRGHVWQIRVPREECKRRV
jgi:hypothetical protein